MFQAKWKNNSKTTRGTYNTWCNMRARCHQPGSSGYEHYGARGIKVCERWYNDYDAFVEDMGFRPHGKSIERINNDGNYEPGNCRWATTREQSRNTRRTRKIAGRLAADVADELQIPRSTLYGRLANGCSETIAMTQGTLQSPPKHGTVSMYVSQKCRCDLCRAANATYMRENRHRFPSMSSEYRRQKYRER